jgi:hypothetical protein
MRQGVVNQAKLSKGISKLTMRSFQNRKLKKGEILKEREIYGRARPGKI